MKYRTKRLCQRWLYALTALMMAISVLFSNGIFGMSKTAAADDETSIPTLRLTDYDFWINGVNYKDVISVKNGDKVQVSLSWNIENNLNSPNGEYEVEIPTNGIDIYLLPGEGADPTLYDTNGEAIGEYTVYQRDGSNWFKITLNEAAKKKSDIMGGALLEGDIKIGLGEGAQNGEDVQIGVGDITIDVPYTDESDVGTITVTKSAVDAIKYDREAGVYYQDYSVSVVMSGGTINFPVLVDDLAGSELYGEAKARRTSGTLINGEPTISTAGGKLTVEFPNIKLTGTQRVTYTVTYSLVIPEEQIFGSDGKLEPNFEENNVTVTGEGPFGEPIEASDSAVPVPVEPSVSKVGAAQNSTVIFDSESGKFYSFAKYTITIRYGTEEFKLSEDEILEALISLIDTPDSRLKPWYYNSKNNTLDKTGAEAQKSQRVMDRTLTADDFMVNFTTGTYTLEYYMAFEIDPLSEDMPTFANEVAVPDAVPNRKPEFKDDAEVTPDIGIDILKKASEKAPEDAADDSRRGFNVSVDFGKLEHFDATNFNIIDKLSPSNENQTTPDMLFVDNISDSVQQFNFLKDFTVKFTYANGSPVSIKMQRGNYILSSSRIYDRSQLGFYYTPEVSTEWFNAYYSSDGSYISTKTMSLNMMDNNNSSAAYDLPFTLKYNSTEFVISDFDQQFVDLLIENKINMTISYSVTKSSKLAQNASASVKNTVDLTFDAWPEDQPSDKHHVEKQASADQSFTPTTPTYSISKSRTTDGFTATGDYGNRYFQKEATPTPDGFLGAYVPYFEEGTAVWKIEVPLDLFRGNSTQKFHIEDTMSYGLKIKKDSIHTFVKLDKDHERYTSDCGDYYEPRDFYLITEVYSETVNDDGSTTYKLRFNNDATNNQGEDDRIPSRIYNLYSAPFAEDTIVIIYETEIDYDALESYLASKNSYSTTLYNVATPDVAGAKGTTSSDKFEESFPHYITKNGTIDMEAYEKNEIIAHYTLNVNSNNDDLSAGDTIQVKDTLPAGFYLRENTIVVKQGSTVVTDYDFAYNEADNSFTFTLNDKTGYTITYDVKIDAEPKPGWNSADKSTNTAEIIGLSAFQGSDKHDFSSFTITGRVWAIATDGAVTIHKYAKDSDSGKLVSRDLENAEFSLYSIYNNRGAVYGDDGNIGKKLDITNSRTDENGKLRIAGLLLDTIYRVEETTPPDGYMDEHTTALFFILKGADGVTDPRTIPEGERTEEQKKAAEILGDAALLVYNPADNEEARTIGYENTKKIDIDGSKKWSVGTHNDAVPDFDADPESNPVQLTIERTITPDDDKSWATYNGAYTVTWTKKSATEWSYTVADLPAYYIDGTTVQEWEYRVVEKDMSGFKPSYKGDHDADITNTLETVDIEIKKIWADDADDKANYRPKTGVNFNIMADGAVIDTVTAAYDENSDTWIVEKKDLLKYDPETGKEIVYTIEEVNCPDTYDPAITSEEKTDKDSDGILSFEAKNTFKTVDISIIKKWSGDEKYTGNGYARPDITIVLKANGIEKKRHTINSTSGDEWTYTFTKLPKYLPNGDTIEYSVEEVNVPDIYSQTVEPESAMTSDAAKELSFTISNTFIEETVSMTIQKRWNDNGNDGGVRPEGITVQIYADGAEYGDPITLSTADVVPEDDADYPDVWRLSVQLPKYSSYKLIDNGDGTFDIVGDSEIEYTVKELAMDSNGDYYFPDESDDGSDGTLEIVNSLVFGETSVSVTKHWKDDSNAESTRPESITIRLYADDVEIDSVELSADENEEEISNDWSYEFTGLNKYVYREGRRDEVVYTVTEDSVYIYDTEIEGDQTEGYEITNSLIKSTVIVDKVDIKRGTQIENAKLEIFDMNGKQVGEWTSENGGKWTIEELIPGREYTIKETETPDGYYTAEDTVFTVDTEGIVTIVSGNDADFDEDGTLLINDALITSSITVDKMDIANGEEVEGAKLELFDKDGNKIGEWISKKGEKWTIEELIPGMEYTLKETITPEGYETALETVFIVDAEGNVTILNGDDASISDGVLIINDTAKEIEVVSVTIDKMDVTNGKEVEGAKLELFDKDGNKVGEWISKKGEKWAIELIPGVEYTIKETVTPDGYKALSSDIVFIVDTDGTVTVVSGADGIVDKDTGILLVNNTLTTIDTNSDSESDSGSGSSSSSSSNDKSNDQSPATGSVPARACAACALILLSAAVIAGKKEEETDK